MELSRLIDFHAVAMEKSFSKAARKLYKTQPAVSQAVRLLEREVGEPLFVRLGRRIELTQAGEVLLEHTRQALDTLEEARARIEGLKGLAEGILRLGASDTTACYVLPPSLEAFRRAYPGVEIVISNRTSPVVLRHVLSGEVDLGIVTLPVRHPAVAVRELFVREDVVITSPRHPLAGRPRIEVEELAAQPLLLLDRGSSTRAFIDRQLSEAGVTPRIAMELGSIEVIKKMVQLDFGVSIVPLVAVEQEVERGSLCAVRVFAGDQARKLGVIHVRKRFLSPAAREFLKMLVAGPGAPVE